MQIGLMIEGQWGLTWERWRSLLTAAEDYGYQCVFRSDHYTIGPPDQDSLETWVSLTFAAMQTKRLEFGPLVCPTTFRHPALTTRMAAQVDDLSGGLPRTLQAAGRTVDSAGQAAGGSQAIVDDRIDLW